MSKEFYQIIVGGEPLTWVEETSFWIDRAEVCAVLNELQDYTNPRAIRVWKVWPHDTHGLYTVPQVEDVTCEIAVMMANARLASDGESIEPDTLSWPEKFFGSFAAFHADDYCETAVNEALAERMEAAE
jgi:hypothetical protein